MRRSRSLSLAVILLAVSTIAAFAETVVPAKLSLADAVALAMTENVDLKSALQGQKSSVSRFKIAALKTSYSVASTVDVTSRRDESRLSNLVYTNLTYNNPVGTEATLQLSPFGIGYERGNVGLIVRHPLTQGKGPLSEKGNMILSAKSDMAIRDFSLYQSRQSTVMGVIEAYYDAVLSRERVKVQETAVELAKEVADGTRKREAAGLMTGIQVSRADISVARTENTLNIQRTSARGALDRLMLSIGSGIGQTPELSDSIPETVPEVPTLEDAIKKALANRTELRADAERIVTQERDLAIRKDEFHPAVNAIARYSSSSNDTGFVSIFEQGTSLMGLELSVPLDRRVIRENHDISERELAIMREQRAFRMEEISEEVRNAYRRVESARISLQIYGQNLAVAEEGLHLAERMVEEGEGSNRDVLDAQQALTDVQIGLLSAKNDLYIACLRLKYAIGEDLTTMGLK